MKKIIIIISLLLYSGVLSAQEQKLKSVLFEEFTAEWCKYCPKEYPAIERLAKAFKQKGIEVSVVAHHINDNFSLRKSEYTSQNVGLNSYPSTSINRKAPSWKNSLITSIQWVNTEDFVEKYIANNKDLAEFTKTSAIVQDDILKVKVEGRVLDKANQEDCHLTGIVTEDNVQGIWQQNKYDPANSGRNYTHHKMARAYLTLGIGEKLNPKADGSFALELKEFQLNNEWKRDDLRVVIFVSKRLTNPNMSQRYVLTSQTLKLNETRETKDESSTAIEDLQKDKAIVYVRLGKIHIAGLYDSVEVYDLQGRLLARNLKQTYAQGIYIVKIIKDGKAQSYKISL